MKKLINNATKFLIATAILAAFTVHTSYAQTSGDTLQGSAVIPTTDTAFISKNIMDNMMEIQLSKLGLKNGSSQAVKKLSGMMIKDHTMILASLKAAARKKQMTMPGMSGMGSMGMMTGPVPDLSTLTGSAFDNAWVTQMLLMHNNKVTELKTTVNATNFGPDVKTLARTALTKIKVHQKTLEGLAAANK